MRCSILLVSTALAISLAAPGSAQTVRPATSDAPRTVNTTDGDDFHGPDDDLVVTAPYFRSLDLLGSVGVIEGDTLARDIRAQIGDSLARQPGVSATSFSPGASRPVLRGFQGERVRVLIDGIGAIDASNTSADHAVAINPLTAERIEILRGPASLLFGSSASGGAVNVFDRRIPRSIPDEALHIDALATYGSAADERSALGSIDLPVAGGLVLHVDGGYTRTNDLRIGGFQIAPGLRADLLADAEEERSEGNFEEADELQSIATNRGRIPNSATETWSAAGGLSWISGGSSLGISLGYFDSRYGVPARPGAGHHHDEEGEEEGGEAPVTIGLEQWRADLRGEIALGNGWFDQLRIRAGFADYEHIEFEGDEIGTRFLNQGIEARAELVQASRDGWRGATGIQYLYRDFNAIGAEAFVPQNDTEQFAIFTLQEVAIGRWDIEGAVRYETTRVEARSLNLGRRFNAVSGALGLSYALDEASSRVGVNIARTSRAPSAEELFSDGPHIATQAFEVGDPDLGMERSWNVEGYVRLRLGDARINLSGYANWFDGFIFETETGMIEDDLPVFQYLQADARFVGFEAEITAPVAQFSGYTLSLEGVADYVRARISNGGGNIPRIPPLRLRGGAEVANDTLSLRGEVEWTAEQNRIASFETSSQSFTLVNASVSWRPLGRDRGVTVMVSGNNLFDVDARRHASFTKDFVPLGGRDVRLTVRLSL